MANTANKLTPQQRAALFGVSTRQHFQMLGTQTVSGGAQTVSFTIPKARILQSVKLLCKCDVKLSAATGESVIKPLDAYRIIRMVRLDLNNGFAPIVASGADLALMSSLSPKTGTFFASNRDSVCRVSAEAKWKATSSGTNNHFEFLLDIPVTINERDPVGFILAQNAETNISLSVDIDNVTAIPFGISSVKAELTNMELSPMVVTYSVPNNPNAFPDMSVLRVVESRAENFSGGGTTHIKLPCGMIYRKLILRFTDDSGNPINPNQFNSNFELLLNTADIPYSISAEMLRNLNTMQLGCDLPDGCYAFDFSYQGISGYGGSRDYVDTETITEFMLRFNSSVSGKVEIIAEKLSRLI